MGSTAMLSLDLERGVSDDRRQKFYDYLANANWRKIPKVTTTWWARFQDGIPDSTAVDVTRSDVRNAASYAGIASIEAVVHVGDGAPVSL